MTDLESHIEALWDGYDQARQDMYREVSGARFAIAEFRHLLDDQQSDLEDLYLEVIREGDAAEVLAVGPTRTKGAQKQEFVSPAVALNWLAEHRIAGDASVEIRLDPGTYTFSSPLEVRHPDGDRIQIVGDPEFPESVVLEFAGTDAIVLRGDLGLLAGVSVRASASTASAIRVGPGRSLSLEDVQLDASRLTLRGERSSSVIARRTVFAAGAIEVILGSTLELHDVTLTDGARLVARTNSAVLARNLTFEDGGGASAEVHSAMDLASVSVAAPTGEALSAMSASSIVAEGLTLKGVGRRGLGARSIGNSDITLRPPCLVTGLDVAFAAKQGGTIDATCSVGDVGTVAFPSAQSDEWQETSIFLR
jgi:hypothetical protein